MRAFLVALFLCLCTPAFAFNASLYGGKNAHGKDDGFHGRTTACGQKFNMHAMTAATRNHKCGERLRVTNLSNGRSVVVVRNDYGPANWTGKIIDLSRAAAFAIGIYGVGNVRVERVK